LYYIVTSCIKFLSRFHLYSMWICVNIQPDAANSWPKLIPQLLLQLPILVLAKFL
jgi:hypothetical protein